MSTDVRRQACRFSSTGRSQKEPKRNGMLGERQRHGVIVFSGTNARSRMTDVVIGKAARVADCAGQSALTTGGGRACYPAFVTQIWRKRRTASRPVNGSKWLPRPRPGTSSTASTAPNTTPAWASRNEVRCGQEHEAVRVVHAAAPCR